MKTQTEAGGYEAASHVGHKADKSATITKNIPLTAGLCFLLGSISVLAMAPYDYSAVLFLSLSLLYGLLAKSPSGIRMVFYGWSFGFGYFLFGLYWIGNALLVEGNEYAWAYPLALTGLPALLSFFPACGFYIWRLLFKPRALCGFLGWGATLGLTEWLRGNIFTGFPWNLFGYTWEGLLPIAQIVSFSDVYLLTALTVLWASAIGFLYVYQAPRLHKTLVASVLILAFIGAYIFGELRLARQIELRDDISFVLVQPDIDQAEKWTADLMPRHFNTHLDLTETEGLTAPKSVKTTYVIWPETAIPLPFTEHPDAKKMIAQTLQYYPEQAFLLSGAVTKNKNGPGYFNSLVAYNRDGEIVETFNKFHLVPFGEYMPMESILHLSPIVGFSGFNKGPGPRTLSVAQGFSFSPLVCYEIIFPGYVTDRQGSPPDAIINVTNDSWYGISPGPYQHFAQARFRAIEEGIPVIRVANTGFSGVIDPYGKVLFKSELYKKTTRRIEIPRSLNKKNFPSYLSISIILLTFIISYFSKNLHRYFYKR
ncbi:MAG: apolipoprotein N-acyltransferase [Alphaproteobacteria bacterium]|nr:apolipoprotein N-acyltransferase [Alphaproteobacteria bacterium]